MNDAWIADRMRQMEESGIRRAFDLSKSMKDPINLSIGLPDFDVPDSIQAAAIQAIQHGQNAYTLTMGRPELRERLQASVDEQFTQPDRMVIVTSGSSGGLLLGLCSVVNPGDEVILFDPYFVMYNNLVALAGGKPVLVDTYPDFRIPLDKVEAAITPRTKCLIVNSPNNPTGVSASPEELRGLAELCRRRDVLIISDEVYRLFSYDAPSASPAQWNDDVLVVDGFSKSLGMTGWRLGYAHGPSAWIRQMAKLQQFSFICAPSPLQAAIEDAIHLDRSAQAALYRQKRDRVLEALSGLYRLARPSGAFYAFPQVPEGYASASEFMQAAVQRNLLIISGNTFSQKDTHFRLSYAVDDHTLDRGLDVLRGLAQDARSRA